MMSMIPAEVYVEEFKNCTLKQMIKEKDRLHKEIRKLEKLILERYDPEPGMEGFDSSLQVRYYNGIRRQSSEWYNFPSVDTRYEEALKSMSLMCEMIKDKCDKSRKEYIYGKNK